MITKVTGLRDGNCQFWALASGIFLVMVVASIIWYIWSPPELLIDAELRGCEVVPPPQNFLEAALRYESADPEADARQAVARGDRRLWVVGEGDSLIPGVEPRLFQWYMRNFKGRTMYLPDVIEGPAEARFQDAFFRYTERYNATVVAVSDR